MTETELRDAYLDTFLEPDMSLRAKMLEPLLEEAKQAGFETWRLIIKAEIAICGERYAEALALTDSVLSKEPQNTFALRCKGFCLAKLDRYVDALNAYEQMINILAKSEDLAARRQLAMALANKAFTLSELNQREEAIAVYDDAIARFRDDPHVTFRYVAAKAMVNKGATLGRLDRPEEAIAVYDDATARFEDDPHVALRAEAAKAMLYRGITLGRLDRPEEAITVYDDAIARFQDDPHVALREQAAMAMVNKGVALGRLDRLEDEIAVYHHAIARFRDDPHAALREPAARAMVNKGVALDWLDRPEEAIAAYEDVVARFQDDTNPAIRALTGKALAYKALRLVKQRGAKAAGAVDLVREAEKLAPDDPHVRRCVAVVVSLAGEDAEDEKQRALDAVKDDPLATWQVYKEITQAKVKKEDRDRYSESMAARQKRADDFLAADSRFDPGVSFLLILREWNSYTPMVPAEQEADRGGGYFIRHRGQGIVIDPGFDFIENLHRAAGRIHDVDHVVLTHAHSDHTAEFEALLTLIHEYNERRKGEGGDRPAAEKRIRVYLNQGAGRKFAGLIDLRGSDVIKDVTVLNPADPTDAQTVTLFEGASLTVLPAYHDDVITENTAVGLAFEFGFKRRKTTKRIVFTGDTGLFPSRKTARGEKRAIPREGTEVCTGYPDVAKKPDLLVVHIGSVKKFEFDPFPRGPEDKPTFYPNHLGFLGTLIMIDQVQPRTAVVSEFGEEMKDIRIELVARLAEALEAKAKGEKRKEPFVIPGDPIHVYRISNGQFLAHDTRKFTPTSKLTIQPEREPGPGRAEKKIRRPYLFTTGLSRTDHPDVLVERYHDRCRFEPDRLPNLPHFKRGKKKRKRDR